MDNMNRRTNTNYQNNLRNSISEYISNNLDQLTRNNQNQRNFDFSEMKAPAGAS